MCAKENTKDDDKIELKESHKQFEKIVKFCLILGIVVVSSFIIYYLLTPEPGYVGFGILNSEKKAENYPTEARVNENIEFYITVENHLSREFKFRLKIFVGDEKTELSSAGSKGARLLLSSAVITLESNTKWISPKLHIKFTQAGSNQVLIVELYEIAENNEEKFYNILWLRLNIIS